MSQITEKHANHNIQVICLIEEEKRIHRDNICWYEPIGTTTFSVTGHYIDNKLLIPVDWITSVDSNSPIRLVTDKNNQKYLVIDPAKVGNDVGFSFSDVNTVSHPDSARWKFVHLSWNSKL